MDNIPVVLGGRPAFAKRFPIVRPVLPPYESMAAEIRDIVISGMVTKGRYLAEFEERARVRLGAKHAVAVSSCTAGLMLTFKALGLTGEVVVPSFTFMATVSAIVWAGLTPVFADVQAETTNLDPTEAEKAITDKTCAIVAVHNFGIPADVESLGALAKKHRLKLIFDAAHGFGGSHPKGPIGCFGDAESFSLSPTKPLIAGEGGVVTTPDGNLAERLRIGRDYGNDGRYDTVFPGFNARLAEFNCLLALKGMAMLGDHVTARNRYAAEYRRLLDLPGISFQRVEAGACATYKDFGVIVSAEKFGLTRDELAQAIAAENIDTRNYYDPPAHRQTAYRHYRSGPGGLAATEYLAQNIVCLPIHSRMESEEIEAVCAAIRRISQHAADVRVALGKR